MSSINNFLRSLSIHRRHALLVFILLLGYTFSLTLVTDYGVSADEPTEKFTSERQYKFAVSKIWYLLFKQSVPGISEDHVWHQNMLAEHRDKYYGTFLQWPSMVWEHVNSFGLPNLTIYYGRHALNLTYFYIGLLVFYILLYSRFKNIWLAGLGVFMVMLHPRFFAESFYNNKDILFAVTYVWALAGGVLLLRKQTLPRAVLAAFLVSLAINTRILALVVPIVIVGVWSLNTVTNLISAYKNKQSVFNNGFGQKMLAISIYLLLTFILCIVFNPTSWGNEIKFIPEAYKTFSYYNLWQGKTLYFGQLVPYNQIPWHYTLGYFFATTPLSIVILAAFGFVSFFWQTILSSAKKLWQLQKLSNNQQTDLVLLALLCLPYLAVVISHSVLYNSWRHMYFLYFPAIYAIIWWLNNWRQINKRVFSLFILAVLLNLAVVASWMVTNHPRQFMFYNLLVREQAYFLFERDYWDLSVLPMLQAILADAEESNYPIKIWDKDPLAFQIGTVLAPADRVKFLEVTNPAEADYILVDYYNSQVKTPWQIETDEYKLVRDIPNLSDYLLVKEIHANGAPISSLLRRPNVK